MISVPVIKVAQQLGDLYIGRIRAEDLWNIAEADIGEISQQRDNIYKFTGIQRKLNEKRVKEIAEYVKTVDATFPTAIVLAASSQIAQISDKQNSVDLLVDKMELVERPDAGDDLYRLIVRIIDGQHRIAGLRQANAADFEVNISLFLDADVEDQARIFSVVNLEQTKVSKSLVYELFGYSTSWSPEKCAHDVCLSLDGADGSPFEGRIKRLGDVTPGRSGEETFSQALIVEGILKHIVRNRIELIRDRDQGRRGRSWSAIDDTEARQLVLRRFFLAKDALSMAEIMSNYFGAVSSIWPKSWKAAGKGVILGRTNGFRALNRLFADVYNHLAMPGDMVSMAEFQNFLKGAEFSDNHFTTENYPPGTSGESKLYRDFRAALALD